MHCEPLIDMSRLLFSRSIYMGADHDRAAARLPGGLGQGDEPPTIKDRLVVTHGMATRRMGCPRCPFTRARADDVSVAAAIPRFASRVRSVEAKRRCQRRRAALAGGSAACCARPPDPHRRPRSSREGGGGGGVSPPGGGEPSFTADG
jgi:hypothetical protein